MSDTRLTLVLMAGLPGAGKTTLSIELGREQGWHIIDKDSRKIMHLNQGLEDFDAGKAAYKWSFDSAREILASRRSSVILDTAALHTFILEQAREMIRYIENVQLKIILCVADRDLRNYRLRTRPARITAIRVDPETIADYFQQFRHLPPEPERLTLYTNHPMKECLAEARNYLLR
jgi:predicted kinase